MEVDGGMKEETYFGYGLGAFGDGVLGEFTGEDESDTVAKVRRWSAMEKSDENLRGLDLA